MGESPIEKYIQCAINNGLLIGESLKSIKIIEECIRDNDGLNDDVFIGFYIYYKANSKGEYTYIPLEYLITSLEFIEAIARSLSKEKLLKIQESDAVFFSDKVQAITYLQACAIRESDIEGLIEKILY